MTIFNQMIREICTEESLSIDEFSDGWILRLKKDGKPLFFYGKLGNLNPAASGYIASDKVATYSLLQENNIPAIPHYLIHKKSAHESIKLSDQSYPLVIKPCRGERGIDIFLCETREKAKMTIEKLLTKYEAICLSPYFDAKSEYRCFVLDGKAYFSYKKEKTDNEFFFNLCKGAKPSLIEQSGEKSRTICELAINATNAIGVRFAAVDILESKANKLKVLEINQAFGIDRLVETLPETYEIIKDLYRQAILKM